jgi:hypothetical protein
MLSAYSAIHSASSPGICSICSINSVGHDSQSTATGNRIEPPGPAKNCNRAYVFPVRPMMNMIAQAPAEHPALAVGRHIVQQHEAPQLHTNQRSMSLNVRVRTALLQGCEKTATPTRRVPQ